MAKLLLCRGVATVVFSTKFALLRLLVPQVLSFTTRLLRLKGIQVSDLVSVHGIPLQEIQVPINLESASLFLLSWSTPQKCTASWLQEFRVEPWLACIAVKHRSQHQRTFLQLLFAYLTMKLASFNNKHFLVVFNNQSMPDLIVHMPGSTTSLTWMLTFRSRPKLLI
jgi:hypothetical protein